MHQDTEVTVFSLHKEKDQLKAIEKRNKINKNMSAVNLRHYHIIDEGSKTTTTQTQKKELHFFFLS